MSLPAVGQGALGLECREDDQQTLDLIMPLMHEQSHVCVLAERAMNRHLEGGCQIPIAGFATLEGDQLSLEGRVGSLDGKTLLVSRLVAPKDQAEQLGVDVAKHLLEQGAAELLQALY